MMRERISCSPTLPNASYTAQCFVSVALATTDSTEELWLVVCFNRRTDCRSYDRQRVTSLVLPHLGHCPVLRAKISWTAPKTAVVLPAMVAFLPLPSWR